MVAVPVSGLSGCFSGAVDAAISVSGGFWVFWARGTYRAVRAWSSTGAPDSTAAGRTSPGSLPSITRFGIGEN